MPRKPLHLLLSDGERTVLEEGVAILAKELGEEALPFTTGVRMLAMRAARNRIKRQDSGEPPALSHPKKEVRKSA